MPTKRDVLQVFTKSKLIEISSNLGYKGLSVLTKDEIVSKLSRLGFNHVDKTRNCFTVPCCRGIGISPVSTKAIQPTATLW